MPRARSRRHESGSWRELSAVLLTLLSGACAPDPPLPSPPPNGLQTAEARPPEARPRRGASQRASLRGVELVLEGQATTAEGVVLAVALENQGEAFGLIDGALNEATWLMAMDGPREAPVLASPDLFSSGSLPPGQARRGQVLFPHPQGAEPWTLTVSGFSPIAFHRRDLPTLEADSVSFVKPKEASDEPSLGLRTEIQSFLSRHGEALARRDFRTYLEAFQPSVREAERQHLERSRRVPFEQVELALDGPLHHRDPRVLAAVELTYRLEGQPEDNPFSSELEYELVREAQSWRIAHIREHPSRPLFWRQPGLALHRTHHFLIYTWPDTTADTVEVAGQAEAAYAAVLQRGLPLDSRYVVHLITDAALFRRLVGSPFAVGAAVSRQQQGPDGTRVDNRAFLLNGPLLEPHRLGRPSAEERQLTIAHELVHLALAQHTRSQTPPWLIEGTAVYFSRRLDYDRSRELVHNRLDDLSVTVLSDARRLGEHEQLGLRVADEYLYSAHLVSYLARHFGKDRLLDFYGSYAAGGHRGLGGSELTNERLRAHFELKLETLEQAAHQWLRLQYR